MSTQTLDKVCRNCRFWAPTALNDEFGGADVGGGAVGRCNPAETGERWSQEFPTWPALAASWEGDGMGWTGAILMTAGTFGCNQWGPLPADSAG